MAFAFLLLYLVLTFVRVGELYTELARFEIMNVAATLALLSAAGALLMGRRPTLRIPQPYLMTAFIAWCVFSVAIVTRWLGGAYDAFVRLNPSLFVLLLVYLNVNSLPRLRATCRLLSLLGVIVAAQSAYSYHTGWRAEEFQLVQREGAPAADRDLALDSAAAAPGEPRTRFVVRLRNLGFLSDPNDLSQALLALLPILLVQRRPRRRVLNAALVWLPAGLLLYTVFLTRSRGALVTLAAYCFLALQPKLGRTASILVGVVGGFVGLVAGFTGGRSLSLDESAEGRLEAWGEGIQMLKYSPLWGVGYGQFTDHHLLVAHNSFVHCFSETGLVGYFLWLSAIVLTVRGLLAIERSEREEREGLRPYAHALRLSLAAFLVGAFFLSRTYGVMLFLLIGLGCTACDIGDETGPSALKWAPAMAAVTLASIVGFWMLMRMFNAL